MPIIEFSQISQSQMLFFSSVNLYTYTHGGTVFPCYQNHLVILGNILDSVYRNCSWYGNEKRSAFFIARFTTKKKSLWCMIWSCVDTGENELNFSTCIILCWRILLLIIFLSLVHHIHISNNADWVVLGLGAVISLQKVIPKKNIFFIPFVNDEKI